MAVTRVGLQRALRKMRQDFSRATLRSTGDRAADSARLIVQDPQEAGRPAGEVADDGGDVGVSRADGCSEAGGYPPERVMPAQVEQGDESTLVRPELAAAVTLTGDDEHGYPLDQDVSRSSEAGQGTNEAPVLMS